MFLSDIDRVEGENAAGGVVKVVSDRGRFLAMAVYNPRSQIALRIVSRREESVDRAFIFGRVERALAYSRRFADLRCCRLGLRRERRPARGHRGRVRRLLIVLQVRCLGMEAFKRDIVDALVEQLHPAGIYERNDVPVRELEGLAQQTGLLYGTVPERVEIVENGVRFLVDVKEGQKDRLFSGPEGERAAIAPFAQGARTLDCFTHTGSFALHAAHYGAGDVTGVDISQFACDCATENARLNGVGDRVRFECANAFDYLRAAQDRHAQYDLVVLDPPAFTKTRSAVPGALRGYKEINLRGMKLVKDGGYLVTCSCSQHVLPEMFRQMLLSAQQDARCSSGRWSSARRGATTPSCLRAGDGVYLKCGIYQVFK